MWGRRVVVGGEESPGSEYIVVFFPNHDMHKGCRFACMSRQKLSALPSLHKCAEPTNQPVQSYQNVCPYQSTTKPCCMQEKVHTKEKEVHYYMVIWEKVGWEVERRGRSPLAHPNPGVSPAMSVLHMYNVNVSTTFPSVAVSCMSQLHAKPARLLLLLGMKEGGDECRRV